jgi:ribonucleoside-diphosphate reductase alpha subunit
LWGILKIENKHKGIYIHKMELTGQSTHYTEIYKNATRSFTSDMDQYEKNMILSKHMFEARFVDASLNRASCIYAVLAVRLVTKDRFSDAVASINEDSPYLLHPQYVKFVADNAEVLNMAIKHDRDYDFNFMGMNMIKHSYSLHYRNGDMAERPQYLYMRVAISVTQRGGEYNLADAIECYEMLSQRLYTHATPTLHNSATKLANMLSCFILGTEDDCEEIMETAKQASIISKNAGGIAIHMHNIRCAGSLIKTSNGSSSGLIKQLQIYDAIARCWDQGGGFRKGAIAVYLEPWHGDILDFIETTLPHGAETKKCRDLFTGIWMNDLLIERYVEGKMWSLFSEDTAPGLSTAYGDEFKELYERYEREGLARAQIHPEKLFRAIYTSFIESGRPYICHKDHANKKSAQSNLGTIQASNLCTEIYEVSNSQSYACCTLASICLPKFVIPAEAGGTPTYDHEKLHAVVKKIARYLDNIIDSNGYAVEKCEINSKNYRPIGIGVQGLADVFCMFEIPFISEAATKLDKDIFETIYHAAMEASYELGIERGSYEGFIGSPCNKGILNFDMWRADLEKNGLWEIAAPSTRYDWESDRVKYMTAQRNSLKVALMPTVSTSQLNNNNESFEPFNSNYYVKVALSSNYTIVNEHMIEHLTRLGHWNIRTRNSVKKHSGSLQRAYWIPQEVRDLYLTTWEISQKKLMIRAAIRHAYVDQGQSLNIRVKDTSDAVLESVILGGHALGLKTGVYYLDTKPPSGALGNDINMYEVEDKGCGFACSS